MIEHHRLVKDQEGEAAAAVADPVRPRLTLVPLCHLDRLNLIRVEVFVVAVFASVGHCLLTIFQSDHLRLIPE